MQRKWKRRWQRAAAKMVIVPLLAAGLFLSAYSPVWANPSGATVTAGTAAIAQDGSKMTITTSDKAAINWQSFSIAAGEKVQFIQPSVSSVALNRVIGNSASAIYGTLAANGKVFLINPNGVLFAPGSQVNVGGLVASTRNISDSDFLKAKYSFSGDSMAGVINQGAITASDGGYVALLGAQAKNEGVIIANQGTIALASGSAMTLDLANDGFLNLVVDQSALSADVANSGIIQADGGKVYMSAKTADVLASTVVNNSGKIQARSIINKNGVIILDGGASGTVINSGTVDASGTTSGQTGGTVKVLGETVKLASDSIIDVSGDAGGGTALVGGAYQGGSNEYAATNTYVASGAMINADAITAGNGGQVVVWANDTTKFDGTITDKGGSTSGDGGSVEVSGKKTLLYQGHTDTTAVAGKTGSLLLDPGEYTISTGMTEGNVKNNVELAAELASNNITLATDGTGTGDITVAAPVSWTTDTTLTLSANNNIYVNTNITASGNTAGLVLAYGSSGSYSLGSGAKITLSGTSPTLTIGGNSYTVLNASNYLSLLSMLSLANRYALGEDINASGQAITPIGSSTSAFTGSFDGLGHTISNLTIRQSTTDYVGLFRYSTGVIRNLELLDAAVNGRDYVGALVGYNGAGGVIDNCYVTVTTNSTAKVSGRANVGGLAGYNFSGTITNSHSDVDVIASKGSDSNTNVGGLVGKTKGTGSITDCYSTGDVTGTGNYVGGLVGYNQGSTISYSHSESAVTGTIDYVGGLVGYSTVSISNSYSMGNVSGREYVGGLVGWNTGTISDSYSAGSATTGVNYVGGLVGRNAGTISDSYSAGSVTKGVYSIGGLVGYNTGTIKGTSTDKSYSNGSVTATGGNIGGLVGYNTGTVSNSDSDSNVTLTGTGTATGGLVGNNVGGTIKDSHSTGIVIGASRVGGLVGLMTGTITNCYATGNVTGSGDYVGGLVGYSQENASGLISDSSYRTGTVSGASYVGGLVGSNEKSSISKSYSTGTVTASGSHVGGLVGYNIGTNSTNQAKITDCYATGEVKGTGTTSNNVGGLVGNNVNSYGLIFNSNSTGNVSGVNFIGGLVGNNAGTISDSYSASSVTKGVYSIGGLVGYNTGTIKGTSTDKSYSNGSVTATGGNIGGLVGYNTGTVSNSDSDSNVTLTGTGTAVGGLVGNNVGGTIKDSHSTGIVIGASQVGGLVGLMTGTITNCYATGNVTGSGNYVGGLVGYSQNNASGSISNSSYRMGNVSGRSYVGGLVGSNEKSSISQSYNTGTVAASGSDVGGLVGNNTGTISDSYNSGNVTQTNSTAYHVGGLVGNNAANITNCYVTGAVSSAGGIETTFIYAYVGGLVGYSASGNISDCYSTGAVASTGTGDAVGGLVGWLNGGTISRSYHTTGEVTGAKDRVGGLVGVTSSGTTVEYCYNTSDVNGQSEVGGLIGVIYANNGILRSSYNTGTISVSGHVGGIGGLVGFNYGSITQCYNIGTLNYTNGRGGLVGYNGNGGAITSCYWSTDNNIGINAIADGTGTSSSITGLTMPQMMQRDSYSSDWDIATAGGSSSIWRIYNGYTYPLLRNFLTALTVSADSVSKTYDGTVYTAAPTNVIYGDGVNLNTIFGTLVYGSGTEKNASVYSLDGLYSIQQGYDIAYTSGTLTVNPVHLSADLTGTITKVYDGNNIADLATDNYQLHGVLSAEVSLVNLNSPAIGVYNSKDVATANTVSVTGMSLTGSGAGNYVLDNTTASRVASITARTLTANLTGTITKVYDGNDVANLTAANYQLNNVVSGEESLVGINTNGHYNSKDVAIATSVTVTDMSLTGSGAGNYVLDNTTASRVASITARTLTVNLTGTLIKVYDGNDSVNLTAGNYQLNNVVSGEESLLGLNVTGQYNSKDVATANLVSVTGMALTGSGAGNYVLGNTTASRAASITTRTLTANLAGTITKVYDGNDVANLTAANYQLSNVVSGEESLVELNVTGHYNSKDVATANLVSVTGMALTGSGAGNYVLDNNTTASSAASITPRTLTANLTGTLTKVYDGNDSVNLTAGNYQLNNVVSGEESLLDLNVTGQYNSKDVATANLVSVTGMSLTGSGAGNYVLDNNTTASSAASITPRTLTANLTGTLTKVYDGSDGANLTAGNYQLSNVVSGEESLLELNNPATGQYNSKDVAAANTVSVTGITLSGSGAGNYVLDNTTASRAASITARTLTANLTGTLTKVYDGNDSVNLTVGNYQLNNVVSGEESLLSLNVTGQYNSKDVATANLVSVTGMALTGSGAGNYVLDNNTTASSAASITARTLTANLTGTLTKVYDGNDGANLTAGNYQLSNVVSGEESLLELNNPVTGQYNSKDVAAASTVSVTGLALSGSGAGNYVLYNTTASRAANITARTLTANLTGTFTKVYDGNNTAELTAGNYQLSNVVSGEASLVGLNNPTTGQYNSKDVVAANTVNVTGMALTGSGAGNYVLGNTTASRAANITPRSLTVTAAGINRVYDGLTGASINYSDNRVSGDVLNINGTAAFSDKNVGTDKAVSVSGITISGTDAGNYTVASTATTTANITPAVLTYTANSVSLAQGTAIPLLGGTVSGFVNGENEASATTGTKQFSTVATNTSTSGNYAINGSGLTANYGNYLFAQASGNMTALNITPSTPATYNAAVISALATASTGTSSATTGTSASTGTGTSTTPSTVNSREIKIGTTATSMTVTETGSTLTIATPNLMQSNQAQHNVAVFTTSTTGSNLVGTYTVNSSQGVMSINSAETTVSSVPSNPSGKAGAVTCTFSMSGANGQTAQFIVTYADGALSIEPVNQAALSLMTEAGQKLIIVTGIFAAQTELGISVNNVQAVYLEQTIK